jgi:hypothetical protein
VSIQIAPVRFWSAEKITSALRWWEPARIVYNLVLLVLFWNWSDHPWVSLAKVKVVALLIILAGCANLMYCIVYPVDVFVQNSDFSEVWRRFGRPLLFLAGLLIALALEYLVMAL